MQKAVEEVKRGDRPTAKKIIDHSMKNPLGQILSLKR